MIKIIYQGRKELNVPIGGVLREQERGRAGEGVSRVVGGRFRVWEVKVVGDGCG